MYLNKILHACTSKPVHSSAHTFLEVGLLLANSSILSIRFQLVVFSFLNIDVLRLSGFYNHYTRMISSVWWKKVCISARVRYPKLGCCVSISELLLFCHLIFKHDRLSLMLHGYYSVAHCFCAWKKGNSRQPVPWKNGIKTGLPSLYQLASYVCGWRRRVIRETVNCAECNAVVR